jgi:hypothetical protein
MAFVNSNRDWHSDWLEMLTVINDVIEEILALDPTISRDLLGISASRDLDVNMTTQLDHLKNIRRSLLKGEKIDWRFGKVRKCISCGELVKRTDKVCPNEKCKSTLDHERALDRFWFDDPRIAKKTCAEIVCNVKIDTNEFEKQLQNVAEMMRKTGTTFNAMKDGKDRKKPEPLKWEHTKDTILCAIPGTWDAKFQELKAALVDLRKEVFDGIEDLKAKLIVRDDKHFDKLNNRISRVYKRLGGDVLKAEQFDGERLHDAIKESEQRSENRLTKALKDHEKLTGFGENGITEVINASERRMNTAIQREIDRSQEFMGRQIKKFDWQARIDQLEKDNKVLLDFMNHHNKGTYPQGQYAPKRSLNHATAGIIARELIEKEYIVPCNTITVSNTTLYHDHYIVSLAWGRESYATVRVEIESQKAIILSSERSFR